MYITMKIHTSLQYMLLLATIATIEAQEPSSPPRLRRGRERDLIITSSSEPQKKIIGGETVQDGPNRHPYFALMNDYSRCGAVLIAKKFVLTAAHCVGSDDDFEIGINKTLPVASALFLESDSGGEEFAWSRLVIHPEYDPEEVDSDIAIYELADEIPEGSSLPPIKLGQTPVSQEGTDMTVIGFGDIDPGPDTVLSDTLLETTVDYVPNGECFNQMILNGGFDPINPTMLCGYREGEDSCQGDSGGPLFLKGDTLEEDELVGLVSWGYDCGGSTPGVYTRISYFYDWIIETMCYLNATGVPDYVDCTNVDITSEPVIINATDDGWSFWFDDDSDDDFLSGLWGNNDDDSDDDFFSGLWGNDDANNGDDDFFSGLWGNDDANNGDDFLADDDSWIDSALDAVDGWLASVFGSGR